MADIDRVALGRCLGKLPAKVDPSTPTFRWLMDGALFKPVPNTIDWSGPVKAWPMLGNDRLRNCTIAGALHQVQLWTANAGTEEVPDLDCAIAAYARATGYDPVTGANDNGAFLLDILKYWMKIGFPVSDAGALNRLDGFATIDPQDAASLYRAVNIFGTASAGFELPITADAEFEAGLPWADCSAAPGGAGGHMGPIVDITATGPRCVTWGRLQQMTWPWWRKYTSEAYAVLRREWITSRGVSPSGLTMAQLDDKITSLKGAHGLGA